MMRFETSFIRLGKAAGLLAGLLLASASMAAEQPDPVDRTDPAIVSEESEAVEQEQASRPGPRIIAPPASRDGMTSMSPFVVGGIHVEGAVALPASAFAAAIEPYLGETLTRADLTRLAGDVANVARAAGYGLATAWIPQQRVANGILRVKIEEGRIDAVEARGAAAPAAEHLLRGLSDGRPVRTAELERQLLIAEDLAGISLGQARLRRVEGRNILTVETSLRRIEGRFAVDNWGTSAAGPVRLRLAVDFNGLLEAGDRLRVGIGATPLQPREFQLIQVGYSIPVGTDGTRAELNGYVSRTRAGGTLRDRDLAGRSAEIEAELSHPIVRSRARSLWGQVTLGVRDSHLDRADIPAREDRISTASASLYGHAKVTGGAVRGRMAFVQGIDILGATRSGDPLASRPDADGIFSKLTIWGEFERKIGHGFSFQVSGEGQIASGPLLASEEMGLGGRDFLRGYDYREHSGDNGWAGSAELRFDWRGLPHPARRAQLYVYADAGEVGNFGPAGNDGSLASAGGGIRLTLRDRINAGIEVGIPIDIGSSGRDQPDPRLSVIFSGRF